MDDPNSTSNLFNHKHLINLVMDRVSFVKDTNTLFINWSVFLFTRTLDIQSVTKHRLNLTQVDEVFLFQPSLTL